jgi:hypothetical protein
MHLAAKSSLLLSIGILGVGTINRYDMSLDPISDHVQVYRSWSDYARTA